MRLFAQRRRAWAADRFAIVASVTLVALLSAGCESNGQDAPAAQPAAAPAETPRGESAPPAASANAAPAATSAPVGSAAPVAPAGSEAAPEAEMPPEPGNPDGEHVHEALHGGLLLPLGDHFANVELVLTADTGELTLFVLDAHADNPIRSSQGRLQIAVDVLERDGQRETPSDLIITIPGLANGLTGETVDHTSQFSTIADPLRGLSAFEGRLLQIFVKGQEFTDVPIRWTRAYSPGG